MLNKNSTIIALIIVGVLIIGAIVYTNQSGFKNNVKALSSEEVSEKVINFINKDILMDSAIASLIDAVEENGLYKIKFVISGQDREIEVYASLDGNLFFPDVINLQEAEENKPGVTIGDFSVSNDEICEENGKPIVYFFGSESCEFCQWEHPIVEEVAKKFAREISFHNNMDSADDMEIFERYSAGGIPTLVLGCKYNRTGAGQSNGEEGEAKILTALICKLTDNNPANICNEVEDLVNQIN
ncbi:MAG: thioredoxin family protein [Candidatus Falkowbacteria bacterium]